MQNRIVSPCPTIFKARSSSIRSQSTKELGTNQRLLNIFGIKEQAACVDMVGDVSPQERCYAPSPSYTSSFSSNVTCIGVAAISPLPGFALILSVIASVTAVRTNLLSHSLATRSLHFQIAQSKLVLDLLRRMKREPVARRTCRAALRGR